MDSESQGEKDTLPLMVRLPVDLGAWVRERAKREGGSMNTLIIEALESARAQVGEGESALNRALGRLFDAIGNGESDPRWDALGALLPYLQTQERGPIYDSKARIFNLTAGFRRAAKPAMYVIDPKVESRYNPLDEVRVGTPFEHSDAMNLACALVDEDAPPNETKAFVRVLLEHLRAKRLTLGAFFRDAHADIPVVYRRALAKLLHERGAPTDIHTADHPTDSGE